MLEDVFSITSIDDNPAAHQPRDEEISSMLQAGRDP